MYNYKINLKRRTEEKYMKKLKEILLDSKLYLFGIITLIFFGAFAKIQYAPDTYFVFSSGTKAVVTQFFSCGRFITGIAAGICMKILNLRNNYIYILSYTFAIIFTTISLYKLYNLIHKDIKNKILSIILSTLVIINIFSFELFVYIEKGIMMFSVLMCILAVEQVEKLFINKSWKYMIFSIIYMIIATCSYQGTVGIFVAISLIYILKYSNTIKQFIANNTKVALIYGIPAIFNFMLVRFLGYNSRVEGKIVLLESIKKIILGIKNLFINTYNIMPQNIFMIFILGIIVFSIYKIIITQKQKVLKLLSIFYILAGTLIATIAPQILQNTESIWFVARSSYPMAGVIGILLIYIFSNFEVKKIEQNIIIIFCLMFMCIQLSCFMKLSIDGYITNYQDKQESMKIINKINEYEEQTGIIVRKIAVYNDKNATYTYPNIQASGDINVRAFGHDWSAVSIINLYSGKILQIVQINDNIKQDYEDKDWNYYDDEQIIFDKDTIHLCLY